MGLGTPANVSLADARDKAAHARRMIAQGLDPIAERKRTGGIPTFGEMVDQVHEALSLGFRSAKHTAQWKKTLSTYAAPLADKPVDVIGIDDVLAVLKGIWTTKSVTASRLRGRIEKGPGCRQGQRLPSGRKPGTVARPSGSSISQTNKAHARSLRRNAL